MSERLRRIEEDINKMAKTAETLAKQMNQTFELDRGKVSAYLEHAKIREQAAEIATKKKQKP